MSAIDMTQRKLKFPPRFLPYLEKHRIFELFHEWLELLVRNKPQDHVTYLKDSLHCADRQKDKQRIVFLAPPGFDNSAFATYVGACMNITAISREYLRNLSKDKKTTLSVKTIPSVEESEEESCICPEETLGEDRYVFPDYFSSSYGEDRSVKCPWGEESQFGPYKTDYYNYLDEENYVLDDLDMGKCVCVCPCAEELARRARLEAEKKEFSSTDSAYRKSMTESSYDSGQNEYEEYGETFRKYLEEQEGLVEPMEEDLIQRGKKKKETKEQTSKTSSKDSSKESTEYGALADCEVVSKGWILIDFPSSGEEAEELAKLGVIPTHAIRIIVDEEREMEDRDYKWKVFNWKKVYKYVPVIDIRLNGRTPEQLGADMCRFLSTMPHRHAPMLPRIVLIGARGSGVTTQAEKLARKYRMIHVEFETVMARALQRDDDISKLYKRQLETRVEPEVEAAILEKALLTAGCRNRGWVLTGYPKNMDQMSMLDLMVTPPNRVIFLEVPARECFVRLFYRKMDSVLGDEYKIPDIQPAGLEEYTTPGMDPDVAARLLTHPKNDKRQILHDIESYFLRKEAIMNYCGRTASYVDGNKPIDRVFENIECIIISPGPPHPPRNPLLIKFGIDESYERLRKFRMNSGLFFNNLFLNPPEPVIRL